MDNNPESFIQPPTLPHSPPSTLNLHKSPPLASTTIIVSKVQEVFRNLTNEIKRSPYFSRSYLEHSVQQLHVVMPAPHFTSIHNQTAPLCVQASNKNIFGPQLWPSKTLSLSAFTLVLLPYCIGRAKFVQQLWLSQVKDKHLDSNYGQWIEIWLGIPDGNFLKIQGLLAFIYKPQAGLRTSAPKTQSTEHPQ